MNRNMKHFFRIVAVLIAVTAIVSCSKTQEPVIEYLPVTANNISGDWTLVEFSCSELIEGSYLNISFARNDKTFVMKQNLDSFGDIPHETTGEFNILPQQGQSIIQGKYDHDGGLWAHDYIVSALTATTMTWTAVGEPTNIQKFERLK